MVPACMCVGKKYSISINTHPDCTMCLSKYTHSINLTYMRKMIDNIIIMVILAPFTE